MHDGLVHQPIRKKDKEMFGLLRVSDCVGRGLVVLGGLSAGLVIGRSRVRSPTGAAREFVSPELSFCADSYSVSVPNDRSDT